MIQHHCAARRGVSLVEVVIVLAIIGVLLGLSVSFIGAGMRFQGDGGRLVQRKRSGAESRVFAGRLESLSHSAALPTEPTGPFLHFEMNGGQVDPRVRFLTRAQGYVAMLADDGMILATRGGTPQRLQFAHANPAPRIEARKPLPGIVNYFIGNDPARWLRRLPTFGNVYYRDVYPGVNVLFCSDKGRLRFDIEVVPGADPSQIALAVPDAEDVKVDGAGRLIIAGPNGSLILSAPLVYQPGPFGPEPVRGWYVVSDQEVRFGLADYDVRRPLIIDPIVFSTYHGGGGTDAERGTSIAIDAADNVYVTGETASLNFPILGGVQPLAQAGNDVFVTKVSPTYTLLYATYVGGVNDEGGRGIAVDGPGNAYVIGSGTGPVGPVFPVTPGTIESVNQAAGSFVPVFKLSPDGSALIWSTLLNSDGVEEGKSIAIDPFGNVILLIEAAKAGNTISATPGAFQSSVRGPKDAFLMKLNPTATAVLWATFHGGSGTDSPRDIVVDSAGSPCFVGWTNSRDLPTTPGVVQPNYGGDAIDGYIAKVAPDGAGMVFTTYRSYFRDDWLEGVTLDRSGNIYATGTRWGTGAGSFHSADITYSKLNPTGTALLYSGVLDRYGNFELGTAIAVDTLDNPYLAGYGERSPGVTDALWVEVDPPAGNMNSINGIGGAGAIHGGSDMAIDSTEALWVTGWTRGTAFPLLQPIQASLGGSQDAFIVKIVVPRTGVRITESGGSTDVAEGGAGDSYTVVLAGPPTADVTITATPDAQVVISPATLTFTRTTWNVPQTITVQARDDSTIEGPHQGIIRHRAVSADVTYNGIAIDDVVVNITDNDFRLADAADTSEKATFMGVLGNIDALKNADTYKLSKIPDDDWYAWKMSQSGVLTVDLSNVVVKASGPDGKGKLGALHFRVFHVVNGNLMQLAASQHGGPLCDVPVQMGQRILVWIYGLNFTQASYDLTLTLK